MGGTRLIAQTVTWLVSLAVARILTPSDYGIIGMASVFLGVLVILAEFGIGSGVIAHPELPREAVSELHTIATCAGLVASLVAMAAAWPLARFFSSPELVWVVVVLSFNLLLGSIRTVPQAYLQRELRFQSVATIDLIQSVLQAAATLTFALLGWRYWSLLLGTLIGSAVFSFSLWYFSRLRLRRFSLKRHRDVLVVSRDVLATRLSWYGFQNADFAVIGRRLGDHALGVYTIAWNLALLPLEKLSSLTANLSPAIFAAARSDLALTRRYLLAMSSGLLIVTLPPTVGIALVAPDLVVTFVGTQWIEAIPSLRLLAMYCAVRTLDPLWTQLLVVSGDSRFAFRQNLLAFLVLPAAFYIASGNGIAYVAATWMLVHPLVIVIPLFRRVSSRFKVSLGQQLSSALPAVASTAAMTAIVLLLQLTVLAGKPPAARLLVASSVGALTVAGVLMLAFPERLRVLRALVQQRSIEEEPPPG
jgi:PST family polysaccharide transporter